MMRIRLDLGKTPFFVFMRGTDFMGPKSPLGSGTNQISKKAQNYSHVLWHRYDERPLTVGALPTWKCVAGNWRTSPTNGW